MHVVAGEGMAILAGDGLLTEAFALMAREPAGDDPADGRIPALTPEGQKRQAEQARLAQTNEGYRGAGPYNSPKDLELYTRCIVRSGLPRVPTGKICSPRRSLRWRWR